MGLIIRYRLLWLISLFMFASTNLGETLEQKDVERDTTSKVLRERYHTHMENSIFNEWRSFQDWACNAPQGLDFGATALTETVNGKQFYRIMLFGGQSPVQSTWMRTTTWIYYDEVNPWRTVDSLSVHGTA